MDLISPMILSSNRILAHATCWMTCFVLFGDLNLQAGSEDFPDTLYLKNGSTVSCRIRAHDENQLNIEYQAPTGSGILQRQVSWKDLQYVQFHKNEIFIQAMAAPLSVDLLESLSSLWIQQHSQIRYPQHPIGELGIKYVRALLLSPDSTLHHRAKEVNRIIIEQDWHLKRRQHASILQLETLFLLHQHDEMRAFAQELLHQPTLDSQQAANVHMLLAKLEQKELNRLDTEHPRWQDDEFIRPEREERFHRLIDHCLMPSLFFASAELYASEGLLLAMQTFAKQQDIPAAAAYAKDLAHLYPLSAQSSQARQFLKQHELSLQPDEEDVSKTDAPETTESQEITRRKRYEDSSNSKSKSDRHRPDSEPAR